MATSRRPSPGYLASLAIGCTGIAFLGVALGAAYKLRYGGDPMDAVDHSGLYAFGFAYAPAFASRLIFWDKVSAARQDLVRGAISLVFGLTLLATLIAILVAFAEKGGGTGAGGWLVTWFTALAALSQIASVLWLVRYRQE